MEHVPTETDSEHAPTENTSDSEYLPPDDESSSNSSADSDHVMDAIADAVEHDPVLRDALRSSGELTDRVEERIEESPGDANHHVSRGSTRVVENAGVAPNRHESSSVTHVHNTPTLDADSELLVRSINMNLRNLPIVVATPDGQGLTNEWVHSFRVVFDSNLDENAFIEVDPSVQFASLFTDHDHLVECYNTLLAENRALVANANTHSQEATSLQATNLGLWRTLAGLSENTRADVDARFAAAAAAVGVVVQNEAPPDIAKDLQDLELSNETFVKWVAANDPTKTPAERQAILRDIEDPYDPSLIDVVVDGPVDPSVAGSIARPGITLDETTGEVGVRHSVSCAQHPDRKAKYWCGGHCIRMDQSKHLCGKCVTTIMTPWFLTGESKTLYEDPENSQSRRLCTDLKQAEDLSRASEVESNLRALRNGPSGMYGKRKCPFCNYLISTNFVQVTNGFLL